MSISVAVCDDVELVAASLVSFLESDPEIDVTAAYSSGEELLTAWSDGCCADVLLLDVRMPRMDGPTVARELTRRGHATRIVYVTSYPDEVPVSDAVAGVVVGCLPKDLPPRELVSAVRLVASGMSLLSAPVMERLRVGKSRRRETFPKDQREVDVLELLCRGCTNEQIAHRLNRSASSVKQIMATMCRRAGVANRTELVLYLLDAH